MEFQHTISGLLTKRSQVVQTLRDAEYALADAQADVAALVCPVCVVQP